MMNKNTSMVPVLVVTLVMLLKMFQSTMFEKLFFHVQAGFLVLFIVFTLIYLANALIKDNAPLIPLYFVFLMFFTPMYGAYRANVEFGQPYVYGVLSLREWFLIGGCLWIYFSIVNNKISVGAYRAAFEFLGWASLLIYTYFYFTLDESVAGSPDSFVHIDQYRGLRLRTQNFFIAFGAIYYFVKYSLYSRKVDFLYFVIFLLFVITILQGRVFAVSLISVVVIYSILEDSMKRATQRMLLTLAVLAVSLTIVSVFYSNHIERMEFMFEQMFIAFSGDMTKDLSSNARLIMLEKIFTYIESEPSVLMLGVGNLSHYYNDGYRSVFGYFFPVDVGLIGGVFVYGMIGFLLLFIVPFFVSVKIFRIKICCKELSSRDCSFVLSLKYLMLFSIINMLGANMMFNAMYYLIPLFIVYAHFRLKSFDGHVL